MRSGSQGSSDETIAPEELFHPENIGKRLTIDETGLIHGELFSRVSKF